MASLAKDLLTRSWTDDTGVERAMTEDDILVVAPFNAHVARLRAALPDGIRVGTVDKFQGQQAPVVIYSMASSRRGRRAGGVAFLFNLPPLQRSPLAGEDASLVVGRPAPCSTPRCARKSRRAVNALCRYADRARLVQV